MFDQGIDPKGTFGNSAALELSLSSLMSMLSSRGISKVYWKPLSPNDNSKNQIYLGGDYSSLNVIPVASFQAITSVSAGPELKPGRQLMQGKLLFSWIDWLGRIHPAPGAKLILYPQYPEVRLSGFLQGCDVKASEWMDVAKQGRSLGRHLLIGVHPEGYCVSYLAVPGSRISNELAQRQLTVDEPLLRELALDAGVIVTAQSAREKLLSELIRIHRASPISGKRIDPKSGRQIPYQASNGAGYTLEAELGISPNGYAEPDFEGWEVKAHSGSAVTLMTPEPTGGIYKSRGVDFFIRRYGYPDKNGKPDRLNFGGIHRLGERQQSTGLTMVFRGYEAGSMKMDPFGGICLVDDQGELAAEWGFSKLLEHWNRKHAMAAYVPYERMVDEKGRRYFFGSEIALGAGTDFLRFLGAIALQAIYFDPGIKLVGIKSERPDIKRRSQFRISFKSLCALYAKWEVVELRGVVE
jgi:hypothetical protein